MCETQTTEAEKKHNKYIHTYIRERGTLRTPEKTEKRAVSVAAALDSHFDH